MGERKGQNKYYPPDFDHNKHYSLNNYHGVHHLRERGKKASQGIIIIRFEMPFNCWCLSCNSPIGMGVRYDAEKTKAGFFYSTPIFQFKMTCKMCHGEIIIQTDPEHFQYSIIKGLRRREQRYTPEDAGVAELDDTKTREKLASDPMFYLERSYKDEKSVEFKKPDLKRLLAEKSKVYDDLALNQVARKKLREEKKARKAEQNATADVATRLCLEGGDVSMLPRNETDKLSAQLAIRNSDLDMSDEAVVKRLKRLSRGVKRSISNKHKTKSNPFSIKHLSKAAKKKISLLKNQAFIKKKKEENNVSLDSDNQNMTSTSLVSEDYDTDDDEQC